MKVGQMLSLEGDNLLPAEFAKALEVLRSSAHQMPESQVVEVLTREYGPNFRERFAQIELAPMASASIGQVHRAVTREGHTVALKLQYPGVAESIDSDVDNLASLLALARMLPGEIDVSALVEEVKSELRQEVDYERELAQLTRYREAVRGVPGLRVPSPFPELSTKHVLATELIEAPALLDWAGSAPQELRNAAATRLIHLLVSELFSHGFMQTDPNPANYLYDPKTDSVVLLDFGATRDVSPPVQEVYRRLFRGIADRDASALRGVLGELGVAGEGQLAPEAHDLLIRAGLLAAEVVEGGEYDFARSSLAERLRTIGEELSRYQRDLRPPPPAYLFFQRKLGGSFLLCRQLKARVDCRRPLAEMGVLSRSPTR